MVERFIRRSVPAVLAAALLLTSPVSTFAQRAGAAFQSFNLPYPPDGLSLGQGWDSAISQRKDAYCIEFQVANIEKSAFRLDVSEVKDSYALREARSTTASVGAKAFGVGVSTGMSTRRGRSLNTDHLNYFLSYVMDFGGTFVVPPPSRYTRDRDSLGNGFVRLSAHAVNAFGRPSTTISRERESQDQDSHSPKLEGFYRQCGDYFVSAIHRGARINVLASYRSTNRAEHEAVRTHVSAHGFGVTAGLNEAESKKKNYDSKNFSYQVEQEGGFTPPKVVGSFSFEEITKSIDPVDVIQNPVAYLVTLTPYSALPAWREVFASHKDPAPLTRYSPQSLSDLDLMYSSYLDLYEMFNRIEQTYDMEWLAHYGVLEPKTDSDSESKVEQVLVDLFGGIEQIRNSRGRIRSYLLVLERVFAYCFKYDTCDEPDVREKVANAVKKHLWQVAARSTSGVDTEDGLQRMRMLPSPEYGRALQEWAAVCGLFPSECPTKISEAWELFGFPASWNPSEEAPNPGALSTFDARERWMSNPKVVKAFEDLRDIPSDEAVLDLFGAPPLDPNACSALTVPGRAKRSGSSDPSDIVDGKEEIFSNTLYLSFYQLLACVPLDGLTMDSITQISREHFKEIKDVDKRKEKIADLVRKLVLFRRLEPWNRRFCERGFSARMCRSDRELEQIVRSLDLHVLAAA